jgi:uncharacterized membrane protein (UPF0127 family)
MLHRSLCAFTHDGRLLRWDAEVVETKEERERGLSHRFQVDAPMVYPDAGSTSLHFQMFDMHVAIDIAFVGADGRVIAAGTRKPGEEFIYAMGVPVSLVVEMPAGWVAKYRLMNAQRIYLCEAS